MDICDFHAHILPGVDHGSLSLDVTLRQLTIARRNGVKRIVATSHFYPHKDTVESFLKRRDEAYQLLLPHLTEDMPEVRLGAEVLLCANLDGIADLDKLCIHGTKTILVELPFNDFGSEYVHAIEGMLELGYEVILAHAECYDPRNIDRLLSLGVLIQVNASAYIPWFPKRVLKEWQSEGKIIAIGSDIHGPDKRAYKNFRRAIRRLRDYALYIKEESDSIWDDSTQK